MNEEMTGACLWQVGHIRGHLWYTVTVNQVMMATENFRSDDFILTNRNPWFSSYLLAAILYEGNHDRNNKLLNIGSSKWYIHVL